MIKCNMLIDMNLFYLKILFYIQKINKKLFIKIFYYNNFFDCFKIDYK